MDEDFAYYYMSNIYVELHASYLKRKRNLICGCEEVVSLRVSKKEKNPGRSYFICRDKDCRFFHWADVELTKKNKKNSRQTILLNNPPLIFKEPQLSCSLNKLRFRIKVDMSLTF